MLKGNTLVILSNWPGKDGHRIACDRCKAKGWPVFLPFPDKTAVRTALQDNPSARRHWTPKMLFWSMDDSCQEKAPSCGRRKSSSPPLRLCRMISSTTALDFNPALDYFLMRRTAASAIMLILLSQTRLRDRRVDCRIDGFARKQEREDCWHSHHFGNQEHRGKKAHDDKDVEEYVKHVEFEWLEIELSPELRRASNTLKEMIETYGKFLREWGYTGPLAKGRLIEMRKKIDSINERMRYVRAFAICYRIQPAPS